MSARRWTCPRCGGGVLAPERPRKDDVRRYCLDCSKRTGRLVERICPALVREREQKTERRVAKQADGRVKAKQRETERYTVEGVDLRKELARFHRLPVFATRRHRVKGEPTVNWRFGKQPRTPGHYKSWEHSITVTVGSDLADALGTILHELVHAYCEPESHGPSFWRTQQAAAREAFPDVRWTFHEAPSNEGGWRANQRVDRGIRAWLGKTYPVATAAEIEAHGIEEVD